MAQSLMQTTTEALGRLTDVGSDHLRAQRTVLRLPLRTLADDKVAAAQTLIDQHPEPMWLDEERTRVDWDWVYAVATLDLTDTQRRDAPCDYEIQAFRIGEAALVTLMGEPFVEGQLRIKLNSPAAHTFVAHFCNGFAGYVPTERAFAGGGYETRTANWSKFQPTALDQIAEAAGDPLQRVFA
jgi:hypothetical protein